MSGPQFFGLLLVGFVAVVATAQGARADLPAAPGAGALATGELAATASIANPSEPPLTSPTLFAPPSVPPSPQIQLAQSNSGQPPADTHSGDRKGAAKGRLARFCASWPIWPICPERLVDTNDVGAAYSSSVSNFASPIYMTKEGQLFGDTQYYIISDYGDTFESPDTNKKFRSNAQEVYQEIRYGVTNDLSLRAVFTEDPSFVQKTEIIGGRTTETDSNGWGDPQFGVIDRVLDQQYDPIYADILVSYSPDLFEAKEATATTHGTVAAGDQNFEFEGRFGYQIDDLTFETSVTEAVFTAGRKEQPQARSGYVKTNAYTSTTADLEAFYAPGERWSFKGVFSYESESDVNSWGQIDLQGEVDYDLIPAELQAQLMYRHYFKGNSSDDTPTRTLNSNLGTDFIGVGVAYAFDVP